MGWIAETELYAAFLRMYNKRKQHENIILKPALVQMEDLNEALQRGNPAMLAINKAIADVPEQSWSVPSRAGGWTLMPARPSYGTSMSS